MSGGDPGSLGPKPTSYRALVPPDDPFSLDGASPHLDRALQGVAHLERHLQNDGVARRMLREVRRREQVALGDLSAHGGRPMAHLVGQGLVPQRVQRHLDALEQTEASPFPRSLHDLERTLDRLGERTVQLRGRPLELVGDGATLATPAPDEIAAQIDTVLTDLARRGLHPLVRGPLLQAELLLIRPFASGNEALARYLLRADLIRANPAARYLALEAAWHQDQERLERSLLRAAADRDANVWLQTMLAWLAEAFEAAAAECAFAVAHHDRLNERQWRVAEWFRQQHDGAHDGTRFRFVQDAFGWVPPRTLKRDLAKLREVGILRMDGKLKSARYHFIADGQR